MTNYLKNNRPLRWRWLLVPMLALTAACGSLQKEINVPLPTYANQLVVECYLENGRVPRLTVTESVPYLTNGQVVDPNSQALILPNGQQVQLPTDVSVALALPGGRTVPLTFGPGLVLEDGSTRPFSQLGQLNRDSIPYKIFTHSAQSVLAAQPGQAFALDVQDTRGRHVTGAATMPAVVPIDSLTYRYNTLSGNNHKALLLTNFRDPATPGDAYRRQVHKGRITKSADNDFDVQDRLVNGQEFVLGTSYRYRPKDTLIVTLFHLDSAYYSFRASTREARQANGNPFSQPSSIRSTVRGGIGVFTVLSYDRKQVILK